MIQLSNISKRFETPGKVVEAVKHVTLSIDKGDIFGIRAFPARENPPWCAASTCWKPPLKAPSP